MAMVNVMLETPTGGRAVGGRSGSKRVFTYDPVELKLVPGDRVVVPYGSETWEGVVVSSTYHDRLNGDAKLDRYWAGRLREVIRLIRHEPVVVV